MNEQLPMSMREAKRVTDSIAARLWKYLYEPQKKIELTEFEVEIRKRLNNAWLLLTGKILNDRKAVLAHITWCKDNLLEISERTAYEDIRRAKALFGDPRMSMAIFEKARISAILLDQIETLRQVSEGGDAIDKTEASKAMNQLIRRYNAVNGLEDDIKTQLPRAPITINFNSDPETLKKQASELMQGLAEDAEYSEDD